MATVKLYPNTINTVLSWTNPDNAKMDDGLYATTNGTRNNNHDIIGLGFMHNIPSGSTINNITIEVKYKLSTDRYAWEGSLIPVKDGVVLENEAITTTQQSTTDTILNLTPTGVWAVSDIENMGVLFRVKKTNLVGTIEFMVDYLAVIIDYTVSSNNHSSEVQISCGGRLDISFTNKGVPSTVIISDDGQLDIPFANKGISSAVVMSEEVQLYMRILGISYDITNKINISLKSNNAISTTKNVLSNVGISEVLFDTISCSKTIPRYIAFSIGSNKIIEATKTSNSKIITYCQPNVIVVGKNIVYSPYQQLIPKTAYSSPIVTMSSDTNPVIVSHKNYMVYLEVKIMALANNTVRLKAEFRDFDGKLVSPDGVILKIYNSNRKQVGGDIPIQPTSIGMYQYDYTLPLPSTPLFNNLGCIYYEFIGSLNNKPILGRSSIPITWI